MEGGEEYRCVGAGAYTVSFFFSLQGLNGMGLRVSLRVWLLMRADGGWLWVGVIMFCGFRRGIRRGV